MLRAGVRNRFLTRRGGALETLANFAVFGDWRLDPETGQSTFSDVYSDADLRLRSWLTVNSELQHDVQENRLNQANHMATFTPNNRWSWSVGHRFLRNGLLDAPLGNNIFFNSFYYRINENWGVRATHHYEGRDGVMEEQDYTFYRDFRSWVGSLSFRIREQRQQSQDFSVVFRLSFKALPRVDIGGDRNRPDYLLGGRRALFDS